VIRLSALLVSIALALAGVVVGAGPAQADPVWTPSVVPVPADAVNAALAAVQCPSTQLCVAVGSYTTAVGRGAPSFPLADVYDGSQWNLATLPLPADYLSGGTLITLACPSVTLCQAVGSYRTTGAGNPTLPLIETFTGASWSLAALPLPPGFSSNAFLDGVSCVSQTSCQVVGYFSDGGGLVFPLIENFDGAAWSAVVSPLPADYQTGARLDGVACVSTGMCEAVGSYFTTGGVTRTLTLHSADGISWAVAVTPDPPDLLDSGNLGDVACGSPTSCQAVGGYQGVDNLQHSLIESFDGSTWSLVTVPPPPDYTDLEALLAISCLSDTFCEAVGIYQSAGPITHTLTALFDGSTWSFAPPADPVGLVGFGALTAVTCVSTTWCVAVGSYDTDATTSRALLQIYDGSTWSFATLTDPADLGSQAQFNGVACATPAMCQAVGVYQRTDGTRRPLAESNALVPAATGTGPVLTATGTDPSPLLAAAVLLLVIGAATQLRGASGRAVAARYSKM